MAETRLLLGDCVDLLPEIKSSSIDLIIIDPPYSTPIVTADGRESGAILGSCVAVVSLLSRPPLKQTVRPLREGIGEYDKK